MWFYCMKNTAYSTYSSVVGIMLLEMYVRVSLRLKTVVSVTERLLVERQGCDQNFYFFSIQILHIENQGENQAQRKRLGSLKFPPKSKMTANIKGTRIDPCRTPYKGNTENDDFLSKAKKVYYFPSKTKSI